MRSKLKFPIKHKMLSLHGIVKVSFKDRRSSGKPLSRNYYLKLTKSLLTSLRVFLEQKLGMSWRARTELSTIRLSRMMLVIITLEKSMNITNPMGMGLHWI